jgi:hypothetical protein
MYNGSSLMHLIISLGHLSQCRAAELIYCTSPAAQSTLITLALSELFPQLLPLIALCVSSQLSLYVSIRINSQPTYSDLGQQPGFPGHPSLLILVASPLVPPTPQSRPALYDMDDQLAEQVASLLESTAALQRTLAHVLSQLPPKQHLPSLSDLNLHTPASAQASIIAPGVPIPSRGWQKDHSPRQRVAAEAKSRLIKDGWSDCDDTDIHAARLTEAMLRVSATQPSAIY